MSVNLYLVRLCSPVNLFTTFHSQLRFFWLIIFSSSLPLSLPLLSFCQTYLSIVWLFSYFPSSPPDIGHWHCWRKFLYGTLGMLVIVASMISRKLPAPLNIHVIFVCVISYSIAVIWNSPFKNIWLYHPAFPQQLAFHWKHNRNQHMRSTRNSHY